MPNEDLVISEQSPDIWDVPTKPTPGWTPNTEWALSGGATPPIQQTQTQQLLAKIGASAPSDDSNPLLKYINVNDFINEANPGELAASTYFPSQSLSPVKLEQMPGNYFKSLPVVTGGQVLIPFGMQDARKKALLDAAKTKAVDDATKKAAANPMELWKQKMGKPVYQAQIDKIYQDKILKPFEDGFNTYGKYYLNMITPGNDMFDPKEYDKYINAYHEYEVYSEATKIGDAAYADYVQNFVNKGVVLPKSVQKDFDLYNQGLLSPDKIMQMAPKLHQYNTVQQVLETHKGNFANDIQSWFTNGVTDEKGSLITPEQGDQFIGAVKRTYEEQKDKWVDILMNDPNLVTDQVDKKFVSDYVDAAFKETFEKTMTINQKPVAPRTTINNNGNPKQPYVVPVQNWQVNLSKPAAGFYMKTTPNIEVVKRTDKDGNVYSDEKVKEERKANPNATFGTTYYLNTTSRTPVAGAMQEPVDFYNGLSGALIKVGGGISGTGNSEPQTKEIGKIEHRGGKWYLHYKEDEVPIEGQPGKFAYGEGTEIRDMWNDVFEKLADTDKAGADHRQDLWDYWLANKTAIETQMGIKTGTTTPPPPKTTTPTTTPTTTNTPKAPRPK